jgi:dsRNA-specific ribonuclease
MSSVKNVYFEKIYTQNLTVFLKQFFTTVGIDSDIINILTSKSCIEEFKKSLTTIFYDNINNYEFYEILGDATINKCVTWYFQRRFPQFRKAGGVKFLTRLKINIISTDGFASLSEKIGIAKYVRKTENEGIEPEKLLEDIFESFLGCLEFLVDSYVEKHKGYSIVYSVVEYLLDKINFDVSYEKLLDPKSRLKELFDIRPIKDDYKISFSALLDDSGDSKIECKITANVTTSSGTKIFIGKGISKKRNTAEHLACENLLTILKNNGIDRKVE